jgi:hypothetical protein
LSTLCDCSRPMSSRLPARDPVRACIPTTQIRQKSCTGSTFYLALCSVGFWFFRLLALAAARNSFPALVVFSRVQSCSAAFSRVHTTRQHQRQLHLGSILQTPTQLDDLSEANCIANDLGPLTLGYRVSR